MESTCIFSNDLLKIDISFYYIPSKIMTGKLYSNSNSSFFYSSEPSISKNKKEVSYTYVPSISGKYSMKFNQNLQCPQVITVKKKFELISMQKTIFISEERKIKPFNFSVQFTFDSNIEYQHGVLNSDISLIQMIEDMDKGEYEIEPERVEDINDCYIINNTLNCTIHKEKGFINGVDAKFLTFYYVDRCGTRNILGNIFIMNSNINQFYISYLDKYMAYNLRIYEEKKKVLILVVISKDKINEYESLYNIVAPVADLYPNYCFVFADWETEDYVMKYYKVENNGKIKIIIKNYYNENVYIGELGNKEEFNDLIYKFNNNKLIWTQQSWMQQLSKYFNKEDLSEDQEKKIWFTFSMIMFVLLIILRCYLYEKKRRKMEASNQNSNLDNMAYNKKNN